MGLDYFQLCQFEWPGYQKEQFDAELCYNRLSVLSSYTVSTVNVLKYCTPKVLTK